MSIFTYPPLSHNFSVGFGSISTPPLPDIFFSEVSGISGELNVIEKKEGGMNDWVYYLPNGSKGGKVTLKRGLASMDSFLIRWCFNSIRFDNTQIAPKQMIISLLDSNPYYPPRMTWAFYNVIPVKWSVGDFNAQESKVVIESIDVVFSNMEIVI
jgi:phage tail-like protein